ncbi:hypothetical protein PTSG_08424 [Salpingoeca rosetta]|uniref:Uncharacterized protein n=1 Tax=Salpingoeca rosetta (strain ATCC 50818 / BSB-021) TaxID=946362 RepID=F2UJN1_SALR5|nr:uncharacterized protein PTSG_08424 [Salpingoeca rosetta]EGD77330.1 hypothetical protein PTSG_08424 [Salpingoeca rosetta]|eukprot:XP_004990674.1 hypothetical protein PTSG_08424 [Salpingoeca rosetta]
MTKATRMDNGHTLACFPDETLLDTLSRILNDEEDGHITGFKIVGKLYLPGDLQRPVSKFHGRMVEITTNLKVVTIEISNA